MGDIVFNDADKVNLLFKRSIGFASTQSTLEFNSESIKSFNVIFPEHIWPDIGHVPLVPPSLADGATFGTPPVIKYFDKLQLSLVLGSGDKAYYSPDLIDIIPFSYGDYVNQVQVFTSSDAPLQFGNNGGDWIIDPAAGLLTFHSYDKVSNLVDANKLPKISFYKYIGKKGINATTAQFNTLNVSNISITGGLTSSGISLNGTFDTTGDININNNGNINVTGNADIDGNTDIGGNLIVTGNTNIAGNLNTDVINTNQINYNNTSYTLDYNTIENKLLFDLDTSGILMKVGNTESFNIHSNGNISMFTNTDEYQLNVLGTINATHVLTNSDIRIKENIKEISLHKCLDDINKIKLKSFDFKSYWIKNGREKKNIGVIAQELYKDFPEFVSIRKKDVKIKGDNNQDIIIENFHDVDWEQIYKLSIGAIQELSNRIINIEDNINQNTNIYPNNLEIGLREIIDENLNYMEIMINDKISESNKLNENKILEISNETFDNLNNKILCLNNKLSILNNKVNKNIIFTENDSNSDSYDSSIDEDEINKLKNNLFSEINSEYIYNQNYKNDELNKKYNDLNEKVDILYELFVDYKNKQEIMDKEILNIKMELSSNNKLINNDKNITFIKWIKSWFI